MPLSKVDVVWGDTDRCPYSVGESGSRTTIMTGTRRGRGRARPPEADRREGACRPATRCYVASASPSPRLEGKVRASFGAHFCEVEVDTELGGVRVTKYTDGPRLGPADESAQRQGPDSGRRHPGHRHGAARGHGLRPPHRPAAHRPATTARASPTHLDAPDIEVIFIENDDGYGPFGAKSIGEAGIILAPAARRQRHLQRDRQADEGHADHRAGSILGALA